MKRPVHILALILTTAGLSLSMMGKSAFAAPIEERQGVITEPAPSPAKSQADVVLLGTTPVPADVLNKLEPHQIAEILESQTTQPKSTAQIIFNEAFLIPAIVFGSMTIVSFFILYFSYRKRRDMLDTVRTAIQSGQTLPASFLEALDSKSKPRPDSDLRKAVLLIALGLSGMTVLATLANQQAGRAWSIGLVPTLLGIGYLFLWKQSQKRQKAGLHDEPR
jgi:hypothetical protein